MIHTHPIRACPAASCALLLALVTTTPLQAANDNAPPSLPPAQAAPPVQTLTPPVTHSADQPKLATPRQWRRTSRRKARRPSSPIQRVAHATQAATQEPLPDYFVNAAQIYGYSEGSLYRLYAAVGRISDILLEPGEELIDKAAGDTVRWVVGDSRSGAGREARSHVLVKPVAANLRTNLILTTNRRTYHLDLVSTREAYMASLSWQYPQGTLPGGKAEPAHISPSPSARPVADSRPLDLHDFGYRIEGPEVPWKPRHVYNDGSRTILQFAETLSTAEAAPLFVIGDGEPQLVNYRQQGNRFIVDRLFDMAELRLGQNRKTHVRITRTYARSAQAVGAGQ